MTAFSSARLRQLLVRAVEAGSSASGAPRRFELRALAAVKLTGRVREDGNAAPARIGRRPAQHRLRLAACAERADERRDLPHPPAAVSRSGARSRRCDVLHRSASHKVAGDRDAIRGARRRRMPLPATSPDLNLMEQALAKLEAGLRRPGARTRVAPLNTVGYLPGTLILDECKNDLANSACVFE